MKRQKQWIAIGTIVLLLAFSVGYAWQEGQMLEEGIRIHVVDVGQGDCMVVETAEGNILIDTGPNAAEPLLRGYLRSQGFDQFAYMILSHPHDDHIGNADMILREFQVERMISTESQSEETAWQDVKNAWNGMAYDKSVEWVKPCEGDIYWFGKLRIEVLHAPEQDHAGENEDSLILRMDWGDCSVLLTGDAEVSTEMHLLETLTEEQLAVDMLKISHHGSSTSSSEAFLEIVRPTFAVISAGDGNSFGHPHAEVLTRLRGLNCDIYQTNLNGTLIFYCDGKTIAYKSTWGF